MKLSIIVCVYNTPVEALAKCLDSVYTSTLGKTKDFEVVLVDDGSDLNYGEIIKKYNPVYVKTENRGHFAARTYGLMLSHGEYVTYLDSDDTVTFNYHRPMVEAAEGCGADIVLNDWAFKTESGCAYCESDSTISGDLDLNGDEILRRFTKHAGKQHSYFVLWNKIFKRELLLRAKAEIEKTDAIMKRITFSEDMLITFFAFKLAKKLVNIHTGYYLYHIHGGQSVSVDGSAKIKSQIDMICDNFEIIQSNIGENKYADEIKANVTEWKNMMSRTHYSYARAEGDSELCGYVKEKYGVEKLKKSTVADSRDYIASGLLGKNFESIDTVLRWICKKGGEVSVKYVKKDKYVAKSIEYINEKGLVNVTSVEPFEIVIPKREISLKSKIFHSRLVSTLAIALFPKGSKIRKRLKNKL